jgi:hypothetical protein
VEQELHIVVVGGMAGARIVVVGGIGGVVVVGSAAAAGDGRVAHRVFPLMSSRYTPFHMPDHCQRRKMSRSWSERTGAFEPAWGRSG